MLGKRYLITALGCIGMLVAQINAFQNLDPEMLAFAKSAYESLQKSLEERRKRSADEAKAERERIEKEEQDNEDMIRNPQEYSEEAVKLAREAIQETRAKKARFEKRAENEQDRWKQLEFTMTEQIGKGFVAEGLARLGHSREKQNIVATASVNARERRKADIEKSKMLYNFLEKDPVKKVTFLFASAAAVTGGIYGIREGIIIITDMYKKPQLADPEKSTIKFGLLNALNNLFYGEGDVLNPLEDVILNPELTERINEIVITQKNTRKNGGFTRHIMFYGPPGTGKTLLGSRIARGVDADFMCIAASDLEQLSTEAGTAALKEIFRFPKKRNKPTVLFLDEAELLVGDRDNPNMTDKKRTWFNLILAETGTESRDFTLIIATNKPGSIDKAFLSRCDDRIKIDVPTPKECLAMLHLYVDKWLKKGQNLEPKRPSVFTTSYWFTEPVTRRTPIIEEGALSDAALEKISERIAGFVGRDIAKLVIQIQSSALATEDYRITKALIERAVTTKIAQVNEEKNKFKNT